LNRWAQATEPAEGEIGPGIPRLASCSPGLEDPRFHPAWNEEASVAEVVRAIKAELPEVDVLVCDDGSSDRTAAEARDAGALVASFPFHVGIGAAVHSGYLYAARHGYQAARPRRPPGGRTGATCAPCCVRRSGGGQGHRPRPDGPAADRTPSSAATRPRLRRKRSSARYEHVGLGRYGDPLDPFGSRRACEELARVLAPGGELLLTCPTGKERLCFNAHRIHTPAQIVSYLAELDLVEFSFVDDAGMLCRNADMNVASNAEYGCGFYRFRRCR